MSFSRLALRLAAYEALCPYAARAAIASAPPATPAWPTVAGANVYDSRVDPLEGADAIAAFLTTIEGNPVVILYTDDQETEPTTGDYPADKEIADLTVVLMIATVGTVTPTAADGDEIPIGPAITDPEREALLDFLEAQIRQILDPGAPNQVTRWPLQKVASELHHVHSIPERSADKTERVAQRAVRFRFRVRQTIWPAPGTTPQGIEILPQPLLTVAKGLDQASPAYQMLAKYAAYLANPPALRPLLDIRINANLNRSLAPKDPEGSDADFSADAPFGQGIGSYPIGEFSIGDQRGFATPKPLLNRLWARVASYLPSAWFS